MTEVNCYVQCEKRKWTRCAIDVKQQILSTEMIREMANCSTTELYRCLLHLENMQYASYSQKCYHKMLEIYENPIIELKRKSIC